MIDKKDKIVAGISGGKDSAVMLFNLKRLQDRMGFKLEALLIDEGIAGYRSECKKKAQKLCKELKVKLHIVTFKKETGKTLDEMIKKRDKLTDKKVKTNLGACSICGVFRKYLLNKKAKELKATKLAIGHNADDVAQTFLMNIMRSEVKRMKRFSPAMDETTDFVPRIKPLIFVPERENAIYAMQKNLAFELRECPYAKESFRGEVKNFLNQTEQKYSGIKFNVLNSYLKLGREFENCEKIMASNNENSAEKGLKGKEPKKCIECGENTSTEKCKACQIRELLCVKSSN